jgi:glyoxylase-like metal-dependent hydrolase (beta-lactamase superfamily II)
MEEIASNIYIETDFPGVVLAALRLKRGLLIIDSPFRIEDQRVWKSYLSSLGDGVDKLLVMMDTHVDRTLGVYAMGSAVLGHVNAVEILRERPVSCRGQDVDAGGEWEIFEFPDSIHWKVPDMTYSDSLLIYWDDEPVIVKHRPGAHTAGTWVQYETEKILFVGDSVMLNQPPFLQWSTLDVWLEELNDLLSETFRGYQIISGRSGVIKKNSLEKWRNYLVKVKGTLDEAAQEKWEVVDLIAEAPKLLKKLNFDLRFYQVYTDRLTWGLEAYYRQHYLETEKS